MIGCVPLEKRYFERQPLIPLRLLCIGLSFGLSQLLVWHSVNCALGTLTYLITYVRFPELTTELDRLCKTLLVTSFEDCRFCELVMCHGQSFLNSCIFQH